VSLRSVRGGELLALAGGGGVLASLLVRCYDTAGGGGLDAWDTFGPGVVLLLAAACSALALLATTVVERTVGVPVALGVWTVLLGLLAAIAAVVRLLERPDHATSPAAGGWFALAGALAILLGAWQALRDERTSLYAPAEPPPRSAP
jgi:threonine/homoserine/homoserine lactone efflux protein